VHRFDGWNSDYGNLGSNGFSVYTKHGERIPAPEVWPTGYIAGAGVDTQAIADRELLLASGSVDVFAVDYYHKPQPGDVEPDPRFADCQKWFNAYRTSPYKNRVKIAITPIFNAPYGMPHPTGNPWQYIDDDCQEIADNIFTEPNYWRSGGRPVILAFTESISSSHTDQCFSHFPNVTLICANAIKSACDTIVANNANVQAVALSRYGPIGMPELTGEIAWDSQRVQDNSNCGASPGYFGVCPRNIFNDPRPISMTEPPAIGYVDMPSQPDLVTHLCYIHSPRQFANLIYAWDELGEGGPGMVPTPLAQEGRRALDALGWCHGLPKPQSYTYQIDTHSLYTTKSGTWAWVKPSWSLATDGIVGNHGYDEETSSTTNDYQEYAASSGNHSNVSNIALFAVTGPDRGIVEIKKAGVFVTNVDLYSSSQTPHVRVWSGAVTNVSDAVRATVTGTKNASSSSVKVGLDSWEITYAPHLAANDNSTPALYALPPARERRRRRRLAA
jgi:hypothetical protein